MSVENNWRIFVDGANPSFIRSLQQRTQEHAGSHQRTDGVS
jgi:hypothetical protein